MITLFIERRFNGTARSESYTGGMISGPLSGTGQPSEATNNRLDNLGRQYADVDTRHVAVDAGGYSEHQEEWSLDPQGNLLIMVTDRAAGTQPTTRRLTYLSQH